ncbi:MAG TPA: M23 family metallopeptidase [Clostridia bacterium]|nr:M23 family metallopeptidase [Clostridia bacterium]
MIMQKNRVNLFGSTFRKRNARINTKNYNDWLKKTIIRTIVSTVLLITIIMVQALNFEQPKKILNYIEAKLESSPDIGAYLSGVKKMPGYIFTFGNKVITTMKIEHKSDKRFISPIDGEITTYFNEEIDAASGISRGLIFTGDVGQDIYSVDDGVVIDAGSDKSIGNYIIIKHKGELLSVYKYVGVNHMDINKRVRQGQVIGTFSGKLLLEVWYRNEPADPAKYIDINI